MSRKDKQIQQLSAEVEKWKEHALEAAQIACENCEEYVSKNREYCKRCRIFKIKEGAGQ